MDIKIIIDKGETRHRGLNNQGELLTGFLGLGLPRDGRRNGRGTMRIAAATCHHHFFLPTTLLLFLYVGLWVLFFTLAGLAPTTPTSSSSYPPPRC